MVKRQTMDVSPADKAPASAEILPPPGAGQLEASSFRNSATVFDVSMSAPVLDFPGLLI
jgi:hypothetical protein